MRHEYYFDRDFFARTLLNHIDYDDLYDYFCGDVDRTDNFYFWHLDNEYFVLEYSTMILINWYKHIGRCNRVSKDLTEEEFESFCERLGKDIKEDKNLNDN